MADFNEGINALSKTLTARSTRQVLHIHPMEFLVQVEKNKNLMSENVENFQNIGPTEKH